MQTATIKAGWGVKVGEDFTRLNVDTVIFITKEHGGFVYGTIDGDPDHELAFMRTKYVPVKVLASALGLRP